MINLGYVALGPGAVAPQLRELSKRLIGFENQAAPYAVAELRIHSLLKKRHRADIPAQERRFLADTLDDPDLQILPMGRMYEAIERSRRSANLIKRDEPVMVVIGNPPYVDKVKGVAPWIETPNLSATSPSLAAFRKLGNGRLEYVLANKYVYFWRWATWKAFDAHREHPAGVVALVCSAGFTTGPGFAGMREYLRRTTDEGWVIDLTPEGHQPPMATRFFRGNQQPICVAIFIRHSQPVANTPSRIRYAAVVGTESQKSSALSNLRVDGTEWQECADGWTEPLQPARRGKWSSMPSLADLMPWVAPGVKPNRTWVYAPEESTLRERWARLVDAPIDEKPRLLKETSSTKVNSKVSTVPGMAEHSGLISAETGPCPQLCRVAHRSFDRKWVIPDARLHHRPSPSLWLTTSDRQIYVVEQHAHPIDSGPALVFSALVPDMDYHSGRGGRVLPLYRDAEATAVNIVPGLVDFLATLLDCPVSAPDLIAYLAAIAAHPDFTRRFSADLKNPGVRIPLTRSRGLWAAAVRLGCEVLWLHTYGKRCVDPAAGRRAEPPTMHTGRPAVHVGIPDTEEGMPELMTYNASTRTLHIGDGQIGPVAPQVWDYQVSGMRVLKHWFAYRKKNPSGKHTSPLDDIVASAWTSAMTTELLQLLNVLGRCVSLESEQEKLLARIVEGPLVVIGDLTIAGVLPASAAARSIPKPRRQNDLFGQFIDPS